MLIAPENMPLPTTSAARKNSCLTPLKRREGVTMFQNHAKTMRRNTIATSCPMPLPIAPWNNRIPHVQLIRRNQRQSLFTMPAPKLPISPPQ